MKKFYWSGISNDERIHAISEITRVISNDAIILNFQRFSDISLSLLLEVEECNLLDLILRLKNLMPIEGDAPGLIDSKTDCLVFLHITFIKGTGDLEIEVPDMPE